MKCKDRMLEINKLIVFKIQILNFNFLPCMKIHLKSKIFVIFAAMLIKVYLLSRSLTPPNINQNTKSFVLTFKFDEKAHRRSNFCRFRKVASMSK